MEEKIANLIARLSANGLSGAAAESEVPQAIPENGSTSGEQNLQNPLVADRPKLFEGESSTSVYVGSTACIAFASKIRAHYNEPSQPLHRHYYNHVSLSRLSTASLSNMWLNLPDQGYATLLVHVVFRFIGADYYFFLKKSFLEQLDATYRDPLAADPVWLSKMFTVLALGELYSTAMSPMSSNGKTPGMQFFQQALSVFQDLYEDPTVDYIEALLLIVLSFNCKG
jgi:proline utilization trans-activator